MLYTTMRYIAAGIQSSTAYDGDLNLYIPDRACETIYAVSELKSAHAAYSDDILYQVDWSLLQGLLSKQLPKNILCINAPSLERPAVSPELNMIVLTASISVEALESIIRQCTVETQTQSDFAPLLLDSLYSGQLDHLCATAAALCGNPVMFLSFNFRIFESTLLGTKNPDILQIASSRALGSDMVKFLHDKRNFPQINAGEILTLPGFSPRFICLPILQNSVHIASILLLEDRVALDKTDRVLLRHVAKCYRLLQRDFSAAGPTRLVYEYALVRSLHDEYAEPNSHATRFSSLGYVIKQNLYMLVVNNSVQISVNELHQQMSTLTSHVRRIVGDYGICTSFRGHIVILLNLANDAPLAKIINDFLLFCKRNGLHLGISPKFSDINALRRYYRYALDAIGLGALINSEKVIFNFDDLRVYKFVSTCSRSFSPTDLIPDYLEKLIMYDRENDSELLETLYYYVYTVKNTKKAAELMHIHRNTLLYRLEKIRTIIGTDPEADGDAFLSLMLSFKFLEFHALESGRKLCFKPIHTDLLFPNAEYEP